MDKLGAMDNLGAMDSLGAMDDPVAADTLGAILRRERDRRLWTQDRVAEACGVTRQQLSRYETGAATPSWETFRRVLAVFGVQPRISLERLDADVLAAIARQQRRPPSDWLSDVGLDVGMLHELLAGLEWQATGALALRLLGAPAPLHELETEVVLDGDADWQRLVDNARRQRLEVWDPDAGYSALPADADLLRAACATGDGLLRWVGPFTWLIVRAVPELSGRTVGVEVGHWSWRVASVDRLVHDDPWLRRLLTQIRESHNSGDSGDPTT